jgi:hypothetical protein
MKTFLFALGCLLGATACTVGPQPRSAPPLPEEARPAVVHGTIVAIDPKARLVTVKKIFARYSFEAPADCEIITRGKPKAAFADLRVGDDVVVVCPTATSHAAVRIAHEGVTASDREQEHEREQMRRLLTPSPSERGLE